MSRGVLNGTLFREGVGSTMCPRTDTCSHKYSIRYLSYLSLDALPPMNTNSTIAANVRIGCLVSNPGMVASSEGLLSDHETSALASPLEWAW